MTASSARSSSGAGVVIAGRILEPNSASIVASIASVLANLPMARAKSATMPAGAFYGQERTCLGLTTEIGSLASVHARSKGCSSPPVLSQMMKVGLAFLAYFRNFLIPAGLFSNSRISPVTRLKPSNLVLLMSIPMDTSARILPPRTWVSNNRPSLQSELWVLAARVARQVLFYEQEAVRTRLETGSTTISLTDDLKDQGACDLSC